MNKLIKYIISFMLFTTFAFSMGTDLKEIKVQLQWKHQFEFAGFYMAKELGFYDDIGIEVNFLEYDGTFDIVDKVQKNQVNFAVGGSSIVNDWQNGANIYLLANYFKLSPLALVTRPEITTPSQLVGKRIMIPKSDENAAQYTQVFKTFGINQKNTIFVEPKFDFKSFDDYAIDAYSVFLTNEPYKLEKNGTKFNIISPNNYSVSFNDVNLYASSDFVNNRPLLIKKFVEATNDGWKYALNYIEETVDTILEKYNTQNKTRDELLYEAYQSIKFIKPKSHEIGSVNLEHFEKMSSLFFELGLSKNKYDIKDFYYFTSINSDLTIDEQTYLKNKKYELNICIDPNWMPFEKLEDGKHTGISADILKRVSKELNVDFKLVKTDSWKESLAFAQERKCDILPMTMKTYSRAKYLDFTESYIKSPYVIATSNKQVYINNLEDVIDKKLAMVKGYAHTEIIKKRYPNKNFIEVNSVEEGLKLLSNGEIYGFLDALITIAFEVSKQHYFNIKISGTFNDNWEMAIASRNDEPLLNSIMNKALSRISEDERKDIFNKWFKLRVEETVDNSLIYQIVFISMILILIVVLWNITLYKQKEKSRKSLEEIELLKNELETKNKELLELSVTDQLTKLFNRRKVIETLIYELNRFYRTKQEFSLMLIDIDYFKKVNDEFGHNVGDLVLIEISQLLFKNIRQTDVLGRWGGEEFIIILPHTKVDEAIVLAERFRTLVSNHNFDIVGKKTISIGLCSSSEHDSKDSVIERADKALYNAKNSGRNKVIVN